jgi:hypothetical protein
MKKFLCWMYFYLGVVYIKLWEWTGLEFFYDLYNSSMANSVNIQDQYNIEDGPWVSPEEEQESLNSSDKM